MRKVKRFFRTNFRRFSRLPLFAKYAISIGVVATVIVVSVVPNMLKDTRSFLEKKVTSTVDTTAAKMNYEVYSLNVAGLNIKYEDFGTGPIAGTSISGENLLGNTNSAGEFSILQDINQFSPGQVKVYGFGCKNIGDIDEKLSFKLDTSHTDPYIAADENQYMGSDPRASYEFEVYSSDTFNGTYVKESTTTLKMSSFDSEAAIKPLNDLNTTLGASTNKNKYYLLVIRFKSGPEPADNVSGDNTLMGAEVGMKLTIQSNDATDPTLPTPAPTPEP